MTTPHPHPPLSERQTEILALARAQGRVEVEDLAARFRVTTQTIRRDLNEMRESGLLRRIHGGAVLSGASGPPGSTERRGLHLAEKRAIGRRMAELIPNGCSLIMDVGGTVEQAAYALVARRDLMVVTNSLNVANILRGAQMRELILAGGALRDSDGALIGGSAAEFMRGFKVDFAVIGAAALEEDGSVMDFDMREVAVSRAIIGAARKTLLVADHSKFERHAPVRIARIEEIDAVVTDRPPPDAFAEACARAGVAILIADLTQPGRDGADGSGGGDGVNPA